MRLNLKRTALFMLMILCATMCITEWVIVLFKGSFTWFGLFTNLLELFIACELGEYFVNFKKSQK